VCGRSISTYPHIPGKPVRDGDPICDSYCVQLLEDSAVIAVVADGCNWGRRPMEASNTAKSSFVEYLRGHVGEIQEVRDAGYYMLQALSFCHYKICEGKGDVWEAGTTTLLGTLILKTKETKDKKPTWVCICVSIGDCKAFHYSAAKQTIVDITRGNRRNVDARDSGGRLGPYVGEGEPDLRNLMLYFQECEEEDLILIVSDGVHDNLDPETMGRAPFEVGPEYANIKDWTSFPADLDSQKARADFMMKYLNEELIQGGDQERKLRAKVFAFPSNPDEESVLSPNSVTNRIMKHCLTVTGRGREWMEQNPKEKLPPDYVTYPGKMDHATCVTIKVAEYEVALQPKQQNAKTSKK